MILYHGSTVVVDHPKIIKSEVGRDFGFAFYTTDIREQAIRSHGYDVVLGNIANDNVGETISYVIQGIMRKEDAIKRLEFEKINKQIAFCTARSLNYLTFDSYFECR